MMLVERHLRFSIPVLCAGPGGAFYAHGLEIACNTEEGLARLRAVDADGRPSRYTVLVALRELAQLRRICTRPDGAGVLPVDGGASVTGCDADGHLMLCEQATLEIEHDSLGVLVLAPGPNIPWSLGVPAGQVDDFFAALEDCTAGATLAAVA